MSDAKRPDIWAVGDGYEHYIGRWSRLVAAEFIDWLAIHPGSRWLDVGCGTGALTQTILQRANPQRVVAIDSSDGFVAFARDRTHDRRAMFRTGNVQDLPIESSSFASAVAGLVLNFVPEPDRAVEEMRRVAQPGATVAAYVWDYAGHMQLMRHFWDAAVALNSATRALDEGNRFPDCRPEPLTKLFTAVGFQNIAVKAIDAQTEFKSFDDYWSPFLAGQGPAPGYCMSLSEQDRTVLRERIRKNLPIKADGTISLIARAWAVKGIK